MAGQTVNVWDPVVRLFHWSLVASFALAWASADRWDDVHEISGYVAAVLIGIRLIWGFTGPYYARFKQFVRAPTDVVRFAVMLLNGKEPRYVGHNPLGAIMILALLFFMGATSLTGWMYTTDRFWGVGWVEVVHEFGAELLAVLMIAHVAGVIFASRMHHENLVRSMINGRKRAPEGTDVA